MEKLDKLNYEVVLGMNKFEDINCDKAYRLNYKESTCGTICINSKKSDKDYLNKRKSDLEKSGFTTGKIKEKVKLFYYNLISPKNVKFAKLYDNDDEKKHITKYNNITIITQEALYPVIPDFDYYQHFYKV